MGKTKVFLRAGQMAVLDKMRTELMTRSATTIQRHMKGFIARSRYQRTRRAAITLQVCLSVLALDHSMCHDSNRHTLCAICSLSRTLCAICCSYRTRMLLQFCTFEPHKLRLRPCRVPQAGARGMAARSEARKRRRTHAATVVQAALRMHLARQQYLHTRRAIVTIQAGYRGRAARQYTKDIR